MRLKRKLSRINNQRGLNLISLMIGITISMIAILSMMRLFETLRSTVSDTQSVAADNTSHSSAIMSAEMILLGAAYGVSSPNFSLLTNASLQNKAQGKVALTTSTPSAPDTSRTNAILWIEQDPNNESQTRCAGLISPTQQGGMAYVTKDNCSTPATVSDWTITWLKETQYRAPPWYLTFIRDQNVACSPFGIESAPAQHDIVSISAAGSAAPLSRVCLVNT